MRPGRSDLRRFLDDRRGAAAAEFALVLTLLTIPLLNVIDLGVYVYQKMELENAAQVAAQQAWATCNTPAKLPATPNSYANCPALPANLTTAVQGTSLGASVSITATSEGYYCVNNAGALVAVGSFPDTKPSNCGSVGSSTDAPGDYITITASYAYAPMFTGISVASLLTTPIVKTVYMRLS